MTTLDVSIRARFINELSAGAKAATTDLKGVKDAARQLGAGTSGALGADLAKVSSTAKVAATDIKGARDAARQLGAATGGASVAADLQRITPAAQVAEREVLDISRAVQELGTAQGGARAAADLRRITPAAQVAEREVQDIARAVQQLGAARGGAKVAADLRQISSTARRAETDLAQLNRRATQMHGAARLARGAAAVDNTAATLGLPMPAMMSTGLRAVGMGVVGGGTIAGVGVAAVGAKVMADSIPEAMKFEDAMAEVRKAVDLDPSGLAAMEREILKLSRTTPLVKEDLALLVAQAGFAGRPTEDLSRFASFAAKAAVAFGMTAEVAGDSLAKLGNVFGSSQEGIEKLGDAINVLGDNTASKERDIVEFLIRTGAQAKTFGLAERETAAFGAAMLSLGTSPEVASTGFNALITKLQTASKQGKAFRGGLKALGLNAKQVTELIKKGPSDAIVAILERVQKLSPEKRVGVLVDMFGAEYADDAARLAGSLDEVVAALKLVKDEGANRGSVDRAFSIFDSLTSSKIKKLEHQFTSLSTRIGKAFTPTIGNVADAVAGLLERINTTLDRAADAQALADKLAAGKTLAQADQEKLKNDPVLNQEFQRKVAAADHPIVGQIEQLMHLEKDVADVAGAAARGDIGAQNKLIGLQAALAQVRAQVDESVKVPGAAEAASQSMAAITQAVSGEGENAVTAAEAVAERLRQALSLVPAPAPWPQLSGGKVPFPQPRPSALDIAPARAEKPQAKDAMQSNGAARIRDLIEQRKRLGAVTDQDPQQVPEQIRFAVPALKATAEDIDRQLKAALASPELGPVARAVMEEYVAAIGAEGARATTEAQRIAEQLRAALSFTARPQIEMQSVPGGGAPARAGGGASGGPPASGTGSGSSGRKERRADAGPVINQHIYGGGDAARVARLAQREQEHALRTARAGALHDLGSWA